MNQRFLVIGSNSFSGSNFVARLIQLGYQTIGVSRSKQPNAVFLPYLWKEENHKLPHSPWIQLAILLF